MNDLSQLEALIDKHIQEDDKESAIKVLFELIVRCVEEKNFEKAEALRKKLFDVDPLALPEIIRSGEIIEEERFQCIDRDHLKIWSELYDTLSTEEANALYYALKQHSFSWEETIFNQGERNDNLYFIEEGYLIVVYHQNAKEIVLKLVRPGEVAGEDTFFSNTLCTNSLLTFSRVKLCTLDNSVLTEWSKEFPNLEAKLYDFCLKAGKMQDVLKKKGLDRRAEKRIKIAGKMVNISGIPVEIPFRGSLSDISVGGLSFFATISKKENARLLLGRNVNIKFAVPNGKLPIQIDQNGKVVAVRYHPFGDYSIHVKFDKMLSDTMLEQLERISRLHRNSDGNP